MERIFVVVTPECPYHTGRKVLSMDCRRCDDFRGGIIESFVDCAHGRPAIEQERPKIERKHRKSEQKDADPDRKPARKSAKKSITPKNAVKKPTKTRKKKNE